MYNKVGLIFDGPNTETNNIEAIYADQQKKDTMEQIFRILSKKHNTVKIQVDEKISENLVKSDVDIVFNLSTGVRGESRQSQIPALLEMLGIPYVGSGILAHSLALNKAMAKKIFQYHGVPTPAFQVFQTGEEKLDSNLKFPLIAKPACEGSGFGIHVDSVVYDEQGLMKKVSELLRQYEPPVLVEEFIEGREFTVGVIGNGESKRILPIMEIDFEDIPEEHGKFYTFEVKNNFGDQTKYHCPASISMALEKSIMENVSKAFDVLGCKDIARVDVLVKNERPYILEINSLPGLKHLHSDLPKMAVVAGLSYKELIMEILEVAVERQIDSVAKFKAKIINF
ncbi:D-alanine--D-alanine ligase [Alkaliphilus metalliredigens QYMF]|uniref:D-alanine--D-alanine ligase n=1 Tax=Alkaliphilus metalliredigens (strain QYMF) TaxID=293826 RepID=A6TSD6_ALKMQ|nr:ATP-grasp domain-containing protein [Alkaliphilus metalliredigens]ABR49104.1 D-alanine--D-alanine ligase [Alkaliphilus metalliredigens QYMF]